MTGRTVTVPYAGFCLDRAVDRRRDPVWVAAAAADPRARLYPMWRDQCLVSGDPPVAVALPLATAGNVDVSELVLLGVEDRGPRFAVDLSDLELDDALSRVAAEAAVDIRALFMGMAPGDAGVLAYARGVLHWSRHQRHCGRCGAATAARDAGHLRVCTDEACSRLLFPRIEPAVITLVESGAPASRCLLARHRASTTGGYSLLAGFVEIGESLEDAVCREVREEAGLAVRDVSYFGSQPWPFPAGMMVAFRATANDEAIAVDGDEIAEARWFTRDELREYEQVTGSLGRPDSIDRVLLAAWLAEEPASPEQRVAEPCEDGSVPGPPQPADQAEHTRLTRDAYERLADVWSQTTDAGPFNGLLERPALRSLIPQPLTGGSVLDAGCGSGAQCEWLLDQGADVAGIDLSPGMVDQARRRCDGRARLEVADLSRPLAFAARSFDGVTCSLALHYLRDWDVALASFARILRPDGWAVISLDHPFAPPLPGQHGDYFDRELVSDTWTKADVTVTQHFWRRPLAAVADAFAGAGFVIERVAEPRLSAETIDRFPDLRDLANAPTFIVYGLRLAGGRGDRSPSSRAEHRPRVP
jgi:NADH pyrophosphatase NudC (nudix superfamily)/SAM-dependent methyltransferase